MRYQFAIRIGLVLSITGIVGQTAVAQFVPLKATQTTTRTVTDPGGKVLQHNTSMSAYYRSVSGSELRVTQMFRADGSSAGKTGVLYDNEGLGIYRLDFAAKTASETVQLPSSRPVNTWSDIDKESLGHQTMESLDCTIVPVYELVNGQRKVIGKEWVSPKYDLIVRQDTTLVFSGYSTLTMTELSDIQLNASPDPNLFRVPADFAVTRTPEASSPPKPPPGVH